MLHIYKASAGSGKTYTLTLEYIKLLLGYRDEQGRYQLYRKSDFQLDILAHDTEKSPYVDGLMQLFGCTVEQIRGIASETLYVLLHDFSYFNISTIDRFFQQVLRNFTREIGLQGSFEIEMDKDFVTDSAIDRIVRCRPKRSSQLADTLCRGAYRVGELVELGKSIRTERRFERTGRGVIERNL